MDVSFRVNEGSKVLRACHPSSSTLFTKSERTGSSYVWAANYTSVSVWDECKDCHTVDPIQPGEVADSQSMCKYMNEHFLAVNNDSSLPLYHYTYALRDYENQIVLIQLCAFICLILTHCQQKHSVSIVMGPCAWG